MSMVAAGERMAPGLAEGEVRYVRSPSDLLRLVIALVLVAIGLLVTFAARGPLGDLEREVLALFDGLPGVLRRFLVGVIQLVAIVAPVATALTLAVLRRWRTLLLALLAGVVADLLVYGVERRPTASARLRSTRPSGRAAGSRVPRTPARPTWPPSLPR